MQNNEIVKQVDIITEVDQAAGQLYQLASLMTGEQFNTEPFTGSWTPAQLVVHVTKSNNGIAQGLEMPGQKAQRKGGDRVEQLKSTFLDFNKKLQSPAFILPKPGYYEKSSTMAALQESNAHVKEWEKKVDLSAVIQFPVFGEISKLELLYFVLYHTQRHIHQLKNMVKHFQK